MIMLHTYTKHHTLSALVVLVFCVKFMYNCVTLYYYLKEIHLHYFIFIQLLL